MHLIPLQYRLLLDGAAHRSFTKDKITKPPLRGLDGIKYQFGYPGWIFERIAERFRGGGARNVRGYVYIYIRTYLPIICAAYLLAPEPVPTALIRVDDVLALSLNCSDTAAKESLSFSPSSSPSLALLLFYRRSWRTRARARDHSGFIFLFLPFFFPWLSSSSRPRPAHIRAADAQVGRATTSLA